MAMFTDPLRKCAKDTDQPHPSKDSTTNPSTGWRGFVISGQWRRPRLEQGPESVTTSVIPRRDRHECGPRTRFHGRSRRHHEDADTFADALSELCRVGYPQSPPELRQELIAEQFVRGQSDPELKKYLWIVIRTQKDRKLQTLIEVCTDFSSLMAPSQIHRPEQTFAVHQEVEPYPEDEGELEDIFAVGDRPPWNNRRPPEPSTTPTLQQMFALARRMGYEMRPIAKQTDDSRPNSGNRSFSDQNRGFGPQTCIGRDYSRIKCFSCGQFGHKRTRCPQPDASLPFRPAGWQLQSDNRQQRDGDNQQGNSP